MSPKLRAVILGSTAVLALGAGVMVYSPTLSIAQTSVAPLAQPAGPASFADVVERVRPAVVSVRVSRAAPAEAMSMDEEGGPSEDRNGMMERFFRRFGEGQGPGRGAPQRGPRGTAQGSGFFISADGYVVTNNHVVEGASEAEIVLDGGRVLKAKVVGTDPRTDLALLKADGSGFTFVKFAERAPRVGDWVIAVGNPFGLGGTVTAGIVSARGRDIGSGPYDDFLQIDAPINRGNSGGPTFNAIGEVIGVNTAIFSPSGGNVGIAFAIPSETTQTVVASLRDKGTVARGWIGIQVQPVTADIAESLGLRTPDGALIAAVQPESPAARANLRSSDVITAVNGQAVKEARDLTRRVGAIQPGTPIKLTVQRDGREMTVDLSLGTLPSERASLTQPDVRRGDQGGLDLPRLGLSLAPAGRVPGAGSEGVVVTQVDPSSQAAQRGLRSGDIIVEAAGKAVTRPSDIRDALRQARTEGRKSALLKVRSAEGMRFVAIPLAAS